MKRIIIALSIIGAIALVIAQDRPVTGPVSPETRATVIAGIVKNMRDEYAFPELGQKAAEAIASHNKAHDYESITDGRALAQLLTQHLNEVCKDAHLRVQYSPSVLPVRKQASEPSPAEIQRDREFDKFANSGFTKVERLDGNIGYLSFRNFMDAKAAKRPIKAAMDFLKETDALIIDIRQNGGGSPETVQLICSYFFDAKPVHLNDLVQRDGKREQFWTLKSIDGPRYINKPIYVLVSKRTGSAAEEFSYNLQNLKRATIIGEPTWGGANPGGVVRLDDHFGIFIPVAHAENPITKKNWEGTGVIPDIAIQPADALDYAYEAALQNSIEKKLHEERNEMFRQIIQELHDKKAKTPPSK